ncbi:MAG: hypothetical protein JXB47_18100 [Anaerolineae bacterium]|nr:hypothetical protein [Anaerolineae bacterium]
MSRLNVELSKTIADKINARPMYVFDNALRALDYLPDNARYVEGWMVYNGEGKLESYGWCEAGGQLIDPTFCHPDARYIPGVYYSKANAKALWLCKHSLPLIWIDGDPLHHIWYMDALEIARQTMPKRRRNGNGSANGNGNKNGNGANR